MRMRGLGRVKIIAARVRNRIRPGALILLYHRVAALPSDPQRLCVTPQHFDEQLQVLSKLASPTGLRELAAGVSKGAVKPHSVVLTFDDGAADNLHQARPILERYDCPATVFIASGFVDSGQEFWWDQLEGILLQPGSLPESLRLTVNGKPFDQQLGPSAHYSHQEFERCKQWNVLDQDVPGERQRIYLSLFNLLRPLPPERRSQVIDILREWAHTNKIGRHTHKVLSHREVRRLAQGGLVEIGAHTVTHPVLSSISAAQQRAEIQDSKRRLEEIIDQPVLSFAYPYGERSDYTAETVRIVRDEGFSLACSNFKGVVQPGADLFQLPRFVVGDWNGEEFERRLKEWFRG